MYFRCKNCGGNTVYSPERHAMFCPFCDSERSQERVNGVASEKEICPNCGGEIPKDEHTCATQCPYCDSYLIMDDRIEGEYTPRLIIPFSMGKDTCKKAIREKFKKSIFAPTDFLSDVRLDSMKGNYVPYWFYDYETDATFSGEGTKVRVWNSGNTQYTETSYYQIDRAMNISYHKIPVDASIAMPDETMDLMEPYQYQQMIDFDPEFLSGFYGEKFNMKDVTLEERAAKKMEDSARKLLRETYSDYASVTKQNEKITKKEIKSHYGFLPVWKYDYTYQGKNYPFYVNGQTGKIVGRMPISKGKVWLYSLTLFGCISAIACMIPMILIWL